LDHLGNSRYNELMTKSYDQQRIDSYQYLNNTSTRGQFYSVTNRDSRDKQLFLNDKFLKKGTNYENGIGQGYTNPNEDVRLSTLTMNSYNNNQNLGYGNATANSTNDQDQKINNYLDRLKLEIKSIKTDLLQRKNNHETREEFIKRFFQDELVKNSSKKFKSLKKPNKVGNEFTSHFLARKNLQKKQHLKSDNYNSSSKINDYYHDKLYAIKNRKFNPNKDFTVFIKGANKLTQRDGLGQG
jgi:hypothetical protein